jgi:hypothetical protein
MGVSIVIRASFSVTCCTHKHTLRKISRCKEILEKIPGTEIMQKDQSLRRGTVRITFPCSLVYT